MTQSRLSQTVSKDPGHRLGKGRGLDQHAGRGVLGRQRGARRVRRARSARFSERAVIAMSVANMRMVSTTTMARPSSALKSPARSPRSRSQPSTAGMRTRGGQHPASEDAARMVAGDHRHQPAVRTRAEDADARARGRRRPSAAPWGCSSPTPYSVAHAVRVAQERDRPTSPIGTRATSCSGATPRPRLPNRAASSATPISTKFEAGVGRDAVAAESRAEQHLIEAEVVAGDVPDERDQRRMVDSDRGDPDGRDHRRRRGRSREARCRIQSAAARPG